MFGCALEVIREGRDFEGDSCVILAACNVGTSRFEVRRIAAINSSTVVFANVRALLVDAIGIDNFEEVF